MAVMPYCPVLAPMRPARLVVAPIPPSFATIVPTTWVGTDQLPSRPSSRALVAVGDRVSRRGSRALLCADT